MQAAKDGALQRWQPPHLRQYFKDDDILGPGKPVVVVHNKYTHEWEEPGPVNFLDIPTLSKLFDMLLPYYRQASAAHIKCAQLAAIDCAGMHVAQEGWLLFLGLGRIHVLSHCRPYP